MSIRHWKIWETRRRSICH